jgi:hypothetical protein
LDSGLKWINWKKLDLKLELNGLNWINLTPLDLIGINWIEMVGLKQIRLKLNY